MDQRTGSPPHPEQTRSRAMLVIVATVVLSLLGVIVVQAVAQGEDPMGAEPDFVTGQGDRVFLNDDGTYQVAVAGAAPSRTLPSSRGILLARAGTAAPGTDSAESGLAAADGALGTGATNVYIVAFATQPLEAYRTEIRQLGGVDGDYIPDNALLVTIPPAAVAAVAGLSYVTAVIPYGVEYRTNAATAALASDAATHDFAVKLFNSSAQNQNIVAQAVAASGGQVVSSSAESSVMHVSMSGSGAASIIALDSVQFIEFVEPPEPDTARERLVGGADAIEAAAGYTGTGVNVNIYDNGVHESHEQFTGQSLVIVTDSLNDSHGTATTSVIIGNGIAQPDTRGISPGATAVFTSYDPLTLTRIEHAALVTDPAGPYRAVVTVSPWGNGFTDTYTTLAAEMDEALFTYDLLTVQSMGNSSANQFRPQAAAKNAVSIGGIGSRRTLDPSDDTWSPPDLTNLAGTGPVNDGRIKPDLHFWNDGTPAALHNSTFPGDDGYFPIGFDGTSAASAVTAGFMVLLHEMWADGVFLGTPGLARDAFDSRPKMATAKALAINTAIDYLFTSPAADKNRYQQGWGRMDVAYARDMALAGQIPLLVDETDLLAPFQTNTYTFDVTGDTSACYMRTTMVYTDPAGAPGAIAHRVNDLSLRVTSPAGVIYWGNNGLTQGNNNTAGGTSNTVDTVENVIIDFPDVGTWTVEVLGDQIVVDGHPETPALDADFALVASGECLEATPAPAATVSGTVWQDDDGDMTAVGEGGIDVVTVALLDTGGNTIDTTTTDGAGGYEFTGVAAGNYQVAITPSTLPPDLAPTFDADGISTANVSAVTATVGATTTADFGYQVQVVAIGNRVFVDNDFSGDISSGDTGPPSPVTVELRSTTGSIVATTTTDADGYFLFDRLAPGEYRVGLPLSETQQGAGGAADGFDSSLGGDDPDNDLDGDDNGFMQSGIGVRTGLVEVTVGAEVVGESLGAITPTVPDLNTNLTVDIGLFPSRD